MKPIAFIVLLWLSLIVAGCGHTSKTIERVPVSSSALRSVGYDDATKILELEFIGGEVYQYYDVPADQYTAMMAAPSKGKFFHANIKNKYRTARH